MPALPVRETAQDFDLGDLPNEPFEALYVHVPFCSHKCHYCDFYSITRQTEDRMRRFVDLVLAEADCWVDSEARFTTVFFGGGTPSLLPPIEMDRLLSGLRDRLDLSGVIEWTIETNPGSASDAYFDTLAKHSMHRVSFGAQSFDAAELNALERDHRGVDVPAAVEAARRAGIPRQSLDLIYAIPGQTLASLDRSLDAALSLDVEHLSCYGLTYEPNTPLAVRRRLGRVVATPEDDEVAMFRHIRDRLATAGMPAYEISNFARPGCESRHNLAYWHGDNYLGLGPSAASHLAGTRWRNTPHLGKWERAVEVAGHAAIDVERLTMPERAAELAWLNLRTTRGIDVADFQRRIGCSPLEAFGSRLGDLVSQGLLERDEVFICLSNMGLIVADAVASELMSAGETVGLGVHDDD